MNLTRIQKIPIYLRISLIYILLGGIWIFFSDKFLALFIDDISTFLLYSIYKGWTFVVVTAPILYFILRRDIKLHQQIEDELKKSEERYRYLFDNNPFPMWIYELESLSFLAVNEAAITKYGYTRDEFLQMTIVDIRPQEELPRFRENIAQPRQAFEYSEGWQHCLKDGKLIDVAISSHSIRIEGRDAVLVIAQDITQRKIAEADLLQSEELFSKAFRASPAGLVISSQADGRIIDVNDSYCGITGYTREELIGKDAVQLNLWADPAERLRTIQMLENDGYVRNVEIMVRTRSGDIRTFLDSVEPIELDGEKCIVSFAVDITEARLAEDELRATTLQLKSLLENMRTAILFEDQNRCIVLANQIFCDLFNIPNSAQSLKGLDSRDVVKTIKSNLADPEGFVQAIETTINCDHIFLGEEIRLTDGRYLECDYIPIDLSSRQSGYLWKYRDITARKLAAEALQQSEEKYRKLAEQLPAVVYIDLANGAGNTIYISPGIEKMLGYSPRAWFENPDFCAEIIHPEDRERVFKEGANAEARERFSLDYRYIAADGRIVWVRDEAVLMKDEGQQPRFWQGVLLDITERKQAEEALKASEQRYRHLFENMLEGYSYCQVLFVDGRPYDFIYIDVNDMFEKLTGLKDVRGRKVSEVIPGIHSSNPELLETYGRVSMTGQPERFETYVESLGIWFSIAVYSPKQGYFVAVFDNITERKHIEGRLRESEERFRSIYENMTIGLYRTTPGGQILMSNPALLKMLGYDYFEELASRDLEKDVYSPTYKRSLFKERIERAGEIHGLEAVWERKDGSNIHVRESAKIIRDINGKTLYYEGSVEDISDRKQAEEALLEREARYRGLFEDSPISLWEEDFSAVKRRLDDLSQQGVTDFRAYLQIHPELISECATLVKVTDVNKATLKLFRANSKEELTQNLANVFGDDSLEVFAEEIARIADGQLNFEREGVNQTLDGEQLDVNLVWSAALGHESDLSRVIVSIVDITERKKAEKALRDSELRLSTIFHNSPLPIAISRLGDNQFTDVNEAFQFLTGYNRSEIIGRTPHEINLWVNPERRELLLRDLRAKGSVRDFEFQIRHKSGRIFDMEMSADFIELAGELCVQTIAQNITARKRAEEKTQTHLKRISALRDIDRAITSSLDLNLTMNRLLAQVNDQLGLDAAAIFLFNSHTYTLEYFTGRGFQGKDFRNVRVQLGEEYAGQVALERRVIHVNLNTASGISRNNPLLKQDFTEYYGLPLIAKGQMRGVLEVFHRTQLSPDNEWMDYLETLAGQAAIAIDNVQLFDGLQQTNMELSLAYDATIEGWSHALDLRDKETEGHTQRVTELTLELARAFGLTQKELTNIRWGALLHDIGKMGVPDAILLKPDKLTDEEWLIMKKHPSLAYNMLSRIHYLREALDIPHHHHEKWDGTGYPDGLKGEQIPLAARIFAIIDIWDAVRSDRPYRPAWTTTKALKYIRELSGTHLDPKVVEMFLDLKIYKANHSRTNRVIN